MWNSLWYLQSSGTTTGIVLLGNVEIMDPIEVEVAASVIEAAITPTIEVILEAPIKVEIEQ